MAFRVHERSGRPLVRECQLLYNSRGVTSGGRKEGAPSSFAGLVVTSSDILVRGGNADRKIGGERKGNRRKLQHQYRNDQQQQKRRMEKRVGKFI